MLLQALKREAGATRGMTSLRLESSTDAIACDHEPMMSRRISRGDAKLLHGVLKEIAAVAVRISLARGRRIFLLVRIGVVLEIELVNARGLAHDYP